MPTPTTADAATRVRSRTPKPRGTRPTTANWPTAEPHPRQTNNSTPPTVSFRRIWANRCDSDHEPRVRSRKLAGIGRSLVILAERQIGLPGFAIYGIFTGGAPGSLVGSRTAGDDSRRRTGSSSVAMQPTFGPVGGRQDTVWISPDAHD